MYYFLNFTHGATTYVKPQILILVLLMLILVLLQILILMIILGVIISILIGEENYFENRNNREMVMRQN